VSTAAPRETSASAHHARSAPVRSQQQEHRNRHEEGIEPGLLQRRIMHHVVRVNAVMVAAVIAAALPNISRASCAAHHTVPAPTSA
jgi:hypothetical protein